jgi:hypothetical protein
MRRGYCERTLADANGVGFRNHPQEPVSNEGLAEVSHEIRLLERTHENVPEQAARDDVSCHRHHQGPVP